MKTTSVNAAIEKGKLSSNSPFLMLLEISVRDPSTAEIVEIMRLVCNDEDVVHQDEIFVAAKFSVELKANSKSNQDITLSITDYTRGIQGRMQAYGGGVGFPTKIMIVHALSLGQPPEATEFFEIVGASSQEYTSQFTLGAENPLTMSFPRGVQNKDFCRWRFGKRECGYKGSMKTCDYSLQGENGCEAHGNSKYFGGFPGINNGAVRYG